MKLALVVPGGVDRSGEYRVVPALLALIRRLSRHHEVHVFALAQEPGPGSWSLEGASIHNVGAPRAVVRAIGAILRENRVASFDLVQSIWSGWPGFVAVTAARILAIPGLVHVGGGELVALPDIGYGGQLRWHGRMRERFVLRNATVVSAASEPIIQSIARLGIEAQRVALGADLAAWPPRQPVRRTPGAARLIHVASLNRVKDQTTLLQSLATLAASGMDFHIDVIGEDTLRGEMQALTATLSLTGRTTFHGFLPQRALRSLMETAHINVVSSRHEAGPMVALEAAIAGVPTVGTAVGHIAEWSPGAALSVPPGRPAELADAIRRLLEDEELRLKIASEASRRAITHDADHTVARFLHIYGELIAGRSRVRAHIG